MSPEKDISAKDNAADEIICACSGTTRGQVFDLVQQGKDLDAISRWTGAKTGCGGCDWDLEVFVRALMEQKHSHNPKNRSCLYTNPLQIRQAMALSTLKGVTQWVNRN